MDVPVLNYTDYKVYLKARIEAEPQSRGLRQRISQHVRCQPSYLSQVLNSKPDLTLEQAHRLNQFFHHNSIEARYFLLLVEYSRAGSTELKEFFMQQIRELRQTRFHLKRRLSQTEELPEEVRSRYYSAWFYAAIHVALSIPELQNTTRLAQLFHLPAAMVADVIDFLEESGLIENRKGTYYLTKRRLHLERESDFVRRHHINWRSQALQSVEKNLPDDLHYSTVVAMSKRDFHRVKEILISAIESARAVIGPSKEEAVYALTLDFFSFVEGGTP